MTQRINPYTVAPDGVAALTPVVQAAAEVLKEDERRSSLRAETPVCVTDTASFDGPGWSGDVGILCHLDVLSCLVLHS